jgi:hypothetical protein
MSDEQQVSKRILPQNELDFYLMTTESVWGKSEINSELKTRLNQHSLERDDKGEIIYIKNEETGQLIPVGNTRNLWHELAFYTRDLRLGNLKDFNGELDYVRYYLDLANDLLTDNMIGSFEICLSRVAGTMETSQSRNGFLRRLMNTLIQEMKHQDIEPPKKSLFGIGKDKNIGGY